MYLNVELALRDARLLGGLPQFRDLETWAPWLTFTRAVFGLPMDDADLARFRQHTVVSSRAQASIPKRAPSSACSLVNHKSPRRTRTSPR